MSHSQFDSAKLEDDVQVQGRQVPQGIVVTGPLEQVPPDKYVPPFVIHVTIIQTPTDEDHEPEHARRATGYTTMDAEGNWVATIDPKDVDFDRTRAARGIGVAVLARTEGYTSEVLTWCDHLPDLDGTTKAEALAKAQAEATG
jgi:hypothetical protein